MRLALNAQQNRFREEVQLFLATQLPTDIAEKVRLSRGVGKQVTLVDYKLKSV